MRDARLVVKPRPTRPGTRDVKNVRCVPGRLKSKKRKIEMTYTVYYLVIVLLLAQTCHLQGKYNLASYVYYTVREYRAPRHVLLIRKLLNPKSINFLYIICVFSALRLPVSEKDQFSPARVAWQTVLYVYSMNSL